MKLAHQKASISGLFLTVSFLALISFSRTSVVLGTAVPTPSSSYQNSGLLSWNASYTHSHRSGSWTWNQTWTGWSSTWSRTWSWRTHSYPTYTSTEYACDPNDPYSPCYSNPCNPYDPLSPCYVSPTTITSYFFTTQTIVVTAAPLQTVLVTQSVQSSDFALNVSPSTVSLPPGNFVGSTDFTLNLTSIQGWTGGINITTSPLPSGVSFSNFPSQFFLGSSTSSWEVQVNIGPSAQAGSYTVLIVASSGTLAHSTSLIVEVA